MSFCANFAGALYRVVLEDFMVKVMNNQTISPSMLRALLRKIHRKHPYLFPEYNFEDEFKRLTYVMTNYLR